MVKVNKSNITPKELGEYLTHLQNKLDETDYLTAQERDAFETFTALGVEEHPAIPLLRDIHAAQVELADEQVIKELPEGNPGYELEFNPKTGCHEIKQGNTKIYSKIWSGIKKAARPIAATTGLLLSAWGGATVLKESLAKSDLQLEDIITTPMYGEQIGQDYNLSVNESVIIDGHNLMLNDVASPIDHCAVSVDVDGVDEIIYEQVETVNGLELKAKICNYDNNQSNRSAILTVYTTDEAYFGQDVLAFPVGKGEPAYPEKEESHWAPYTERGVVKNESFNVSVENGSLYITLPPVEGLNYVGHFDGELAKARLYLDENQNLQSELFDANGSEIQNNCGNCYFKIEADNGLAGELDNIVAYRMGNTVLLQMFWDEILEDYTTGGLYRGEPFDGQTLEVGESSFVEYGINDYNITFVGAKPDGSVDVRINGNLYNFDKGLNSWDSESILFSVEDVINDANGTELKYHLETTERVSMFFSHENGSINDLLRMDVGHELGAVQEGQEYTFVNGLKIIRDGKNTTFDVPYADVSEPDVDIGFYNYRVPQEIWTNMDDNVQIGGAKFIFEKPSGEVDEYPIAFTGKHASDNPDINKDDFEFGFTKIKARAVDAQDGRWSESGFEVYRNKPEVHIGNMVFNNETNQLTAITDAEPNTELEYILQNNNTTETGVVVVGPDNKLSIDFNESEDGHYSIEFKEGKDRGDAQLIFYTERGFDNYRTEYTVFDDVLVRLLERGEENGVRYAKFEVNGTEINVNESAGVNFEQEMLNESVEVEGLGFYAAFPDMYESFELTIWKQENMSQGEKVRYSDPNDFYGEKTEISLDKVIDGDHLLLTIHNNESDRAGHNRFTEGLLKGGYIGFSHGAFATGINHTREIYEVDFDITTPINEPPEDNSTGNQTIPEDNSTDNDTVPEDNYTTNETLPENETTKPEDNYTGNETTKPEDNYTESEMTKPKDTYVKNETTKSEDTYIENGTDDLTEVSKPEHLEKLLYFALGGAATELVRRVKNKRKSQSVDDTEELESYVFDENDIDLADITDFEVPGEIPTGLKKLINGLDTSYDLNQSALHKEDSKIIQIKYEEE